MMISPLAHYIEQSISNTFIIKLLYKLFALLYTDYIIMQNTGHLHGICIKNKICFRNIMFTKHNNIENFQHNIGIMLQKHYVCRA